MNVGVISYGSAAFLFFALTLLLLTSWRGRLHGALLVVAVATTGAWATLLSFGARDFPDVSGGYWVVEVIRNLAWFLFLLGLLDPVRNQQSDPRLRYIKPVFVALAVLAVVANVLPGWGLFGTGDGKIVTHLILSVCGLALVEQVFRHTREDHRWAVKFLFLGVGGMFAYDFFLYADALLFASIDGDLWAARGFITAMAVPLVAVSAARNPNWSVDIFVSRRLVFHSASLLGAGLYLLLMAAAGYYIRDFGGTWGKTAQVVFFFFAAGLLLALLFSGQMRARAKVFLNKHFFNYNYDYREEWLRLTDSLSEAGLTSELKGCAVRSMAEIVDSTGGMLWLRTADEGYWCEEMEQAEPSDGALVRFLNDCNWIIDLDEYGREPAKYSRLELPSWLRQIPRAWLVVPLTHHQELLGFVVLYSARVSRQLNWEDRDLLKLAGRQAASYLALLSASNALAESRQFEAFNRLSAYVVHDLKNLVAQLGLVVSNAAMHRENPAFMEDAIRTIDHAVGKMSRVLAQLRQGRFESQAGAVVHLNRLLQGVCNDLSVQRPAPAYQNCEQDLTVRADADRIRAIFTHLVQNAQEATSSDGRVAVRLRCEDCWGIVEIQDSGCGMSPEFVRTRLFKPFDTTKGNAGMGIGAYESREFVTAMGGKIDVTSAPGVGTTFFVWLPLETVARFDNEKAGVEALP